MTALAVLGASVLGSLHCASMCGGFCTAVTATSGNSPRSRRIGALLYHLGRLLGYVTLALVAGAVGLGLQGAGSLAGLRNGAGVVTGLVLIAMALRTLRRPRSETLVQIGGAPRASRVQRGLTALLRRGGRLGAVGIGLASALLPCGWLWGFVIAAAGTGTLGGSMLFMGAFWLGTLPALLSVGAVAGWLRTRLGRYAPKVTAAVLLGLGVLALAGRLPPMSPSSPETEAGQEVPACHRH